MMKKNEQFSEWFDNAFLCSRDPSSPLLVSENPEVKARFLRIKKSCLLILENPKADDDWLRKEIAITIFVSLRCALDYLNYAKLVIQKWKGGDLKNGSC
jgi:hypothetical protein